MRCERQMENWTNESRRACYGVIISIVVVIKKNPFQIQTEVEQLTRKNEDQEDCKAFRKCY